MIASFRDMNYLRSARVFRPEHITNNKEIRNRRDAEENILDYTELKKEVYSGLNYIENEWRNNVRLETQHKERKKKLK